MVQENRIPVACFGPPLSDEKLLRYKSLISGMNQSRLKDALSELYACVAAWWELPESKQRGTIWENIDHRKSEVSVEMNPLEPGHIQQLWDVTPYMDELNVLSPHTGPDVGNGIFDLLQQEEQDRNTAKLEAWKKSVSDFCRSKTLTADELAWLAGDEVKLLRAVMIAAGNFDVSDATVTRIIDAIKPGMTREKLEAIAEKTTAATAATNDIINGKSPPPIPRPALENTELRDMAMTLLWHCKELTLDREPLTNDKLPSGK